MKGQAGKTLRVDLTTRRIVNLEIQGYETWIGGHGVATAVFFDLLQDMNIGCFDPEDTLVIMAGLFAGTPVPGASRAELVGIQAQSFPTEWFGRSNCGGRFAALPKFAGYNGLILEGVADSPTWINICDSKVEFEDVTGLWGLATYDTQKAIFREVDRPTRERRSAILTIGSAGENMSRLATIQHDAGCAFGQGGCGAS